MNRWVVTGETIEEFEVTVEAESAEEARQVVEDEIRQEGSRSEQVLEWWFNEPYAQMTVAEDAG
jgi:hypothetical protein